MTAVGANPLDLADHGRPSFVSLTSAELLRIRSRRLVTVTILVGVAIMVLGAVGAFVGSGVPSAAELRSAELAAAESEAQCRASLAAEPTTIPQAEIDASCQVSAQDLVVRQPFTWERSYREGSLGVAGGFAALLFLIGASLGGADWASRTMAAILYWEPRRIRVMGSKVIALASVAAGVALAAQALWLLLAFILQAARGPDEPDALPAGFISESVGVVGRGALLAVIVGLIGFGVANLTRNTAAALGVGFISFAVLEPIIGGLRPGLLRWQLGPNVAAFLNPGGIEVPAGSAASGPDGSFEQAVLVISNLRAGLWLLVLVSVILAIATVLFVRRDAA